MTEFEKETQNRINEMSNSHLILKAASDFMIHSTLPKYSYNFSWLGRPIIQYPQDIVAMQELIWSVKPDLIIETGIAHGGSLIFSASTLSMIDIAEAASLGKSYNPRESTRKVLGIDIDIREHNKEAILAHPMSYCIDMIEGSSIDKDIITKVKSYAKNYKNILLCLDSNHTHEHVLAELEAYASIVSVGSYCVVFDTMIEDLPDNLYPNRPWEKGNNPKTAVWEFLKNNNHFIIDKNISKKILISVAPDGYLKRVK